METQRSIKMIEIIIPNLLEYYQCTQAKILYKRGEDLQAISPRALFSLLSKIQAQSERPGRLFIVL